MENIYNVLDKSQITNLKFQTKHKSKISTLSVLGI